MNSLEKIRTMAKATANRSGVTVAIYNFNRYSPLYVIRDYCPEHSAASREFVECVHPD